VLKQVRLQAVDLRLQVGLAIYTFAASCLFVLLLC